MGSRGRDERRKRRWENTRRRVFRRRRWVVEEEIGGEGEKIGGRECLEGGDG